MAGVAEPGQRRQIQGLVPKGFGGSNPLPRTSLFFQLSKLSRSRPRISVKLFPAGSGVAQREKKEKEKIKSSESPEPSVRTRLSLGLPVSPRLLLLPLLPQLPSLLAHPPLGVVGLPRGVAVVVVPEQVLVDGAGFPEGAYAARLVCPLKGGKPVFPSNLFTSHLCWKSEK